MSAEGDRDGRVKAPEDRLRVGVTSAGAHRDERGQCFGVELERGAHGAAFHDHEGGLELGGQPRLLGRIDLEQPEFGEVVRRGHGDNQAAARRDHPGELGSVAGREDAERQRHHPVAERQRTPGVGADRRRARMRPRRPPQRGRRDVQCEADPIRQPLEHRREVVAGARPELEHASRRPHARASAARRRLRPEYGAAGLGAARSERGDGGVGDRRRQWRVMAGGKERLARRDHRGVVAPRRLGAPGQQRDVALPRDVKDMPGRAAHGPPLEREGGAAVRAPEQADGVAEHPPTVDGRAAAERRARARPTTLKHLAKEHQPHRHEATGEPAGDRPAARRARPAGGVSRVCAGSTGVGLTGPSSRHSRAAGLRARDHRRVQPGPRFRTGD